MKNPERSIEMLRNLRAIGVQLSLDDFGTGFSWLRRSQEYPLDTLKIDKSFVRDVAANERDASITRTVIAMAHGLGLRVLAKGLRRRNSSTFCVNTAAKRSKDISLASLFLPTSSFHSSPNTLPQVLDAVSFHSDDSPHNDCQ